MKLGLFAMCFLLGAFGARAQTVNNNPSYFIEAYDAKGRPFTSETNRDVMGTPMFVDSWGQGNVVFANRKAIRQVELKFNLEKNELYFKREDIVLLFVDPVLEFSFAYDSLGEKHFAYFKAGYPGEGTKRAETFYQVLESGKKLELLKYAKKTIIENFQYGTSASKSYSLIENYFIYDTDSRELIPIKLKMSSITNALPPYAKKIQQFAHDKDSKLKSEQETIELIKFLNQ